MMHNVAQTIYRQISTEDDIQRLLADAEAEKLHLDFKEKRDSPDFKKILAKAVSGFANADGGVIIWGVAESGGERQLAPFTGLASFEQAVNEQVARVVSFPVEGVDTKRVSSSGADSGYLLVLVPASDLAPHRSNVASSKHYYRRVGDSFLPMEHYEIADAFGRRRRPYLSVNPGWSKLAGSDGDIHRMEMRFALRNDGRAMTLHYGFDLKVPRVMVDEGSFFTSERQLDQSTTLFSYRPGGLPVPLFPGEEYLVPLPEPDNSGLPTVDLWACRLRYKMTSHILRGFFQHDYERRAFEVVIYADGAETRTEDWKLNAVANF